MDFSEHVTSEFSELLGPDITLAEALHIIFGDEKGGSVADSSAPVDAIFIEAPEPGVLSDEDSGDEQDAVADNLCSAQLRAPAEVRLTGCHQFDLVPPKFTGKRNFIDGEIIPLPGQTFPNADYSKYKDMNPTEIFELFFDEAIFEMLVEESNKYALFLGQPNPEILIDEIKCFISLLILSGINILPGRRYFWDSRKGIGNDLVIDSMRRNRFEQILRFLHCSDNASFDQNISDKYWKIRPLIDKVQKNCVKYFIPERELSYDECMIKYYGHHSCKQYIRGKPIRFGYKAWCLNTVDGYLVDFDIYQGQNIRAKAFDETFGKAAAPLLDMIQKIPKLPYRFYFDNLFTGLDLLKFLREEGYGATGTIRENRIPKNCPLPGKKIFSKEKRGSIASTLSKEDGVQITKWMDNSIVTVASNCHGVEPNQPVRRYSKKDKKVISINRPAVVGFYNKFMGGTDQMDENVAKHRIQIRNKKWYWPLLSWLIDVCIHNAWRLYRKSGHDISQMDFRWAVIDFYTSHYGVGRKGPGRPRALSTTTTISRVQDHIRLDGTGHLVTKTENNKQRRCGGINCKGKPRTMCKKCNIALCIECFAPFHEK